MPTVRAMASTRRRRWLAGLGLRWAEDGDPWGRRFARRAAKLLRLPGFAPVDLRRGRGAWGAPGALGRGQFGELSRLGLPGSQVAKLGVKIVWIRHG
jgi:hypothetical protein